MHFMGSDSFLLEAFLENCSKTPERIAFRDKNSSITWDSLLKLSRVVADAFSLYTGEIIPIIVDRSISTPLLFLSCIIARKCFAPISQELPDKRVSSIKLQLGCDNCIEAKQVLDKGCLNVDYLNKFVKSGSANASITRHSGNKDTLLYTLFTSGSTGAPKGVKISHKNILNTLVWSESYLGWTESDVIGIVTGFSFDISLFDFFCSIVFNVPAFIVSDPKDPFQSAREIDEFSVSSVFSAPSFFSALVKYDLLQRLTGTSLNRILSGGDFFPLPHIAKWQDSLPNVSIYNVWGPTETSIVNTMHKVSRNDLSRAQSLSGHIPIGIARHPKMKCGIFDSDTRKELLNPFEVGEIAVIGESVGLGYLNNPVNTGYAQVNGIPIYFTGDLGFIDDSGCLYISGRVGYTVKVNGFRVDLKDIETQALSYPLIYDALAVKQSGDEGQLVLIIEGAKRAVEELQVSEIKRHLRSLLPPYMLPRRICIVETLPKNVNGKTDRKLVQNLVDNGSL